MRTRNGHTLLLSPQPQVRKVFDIVKAMPVNEVFSSTQELDAYLGRMQRQITEGDNDDA
jgi:anti-sigma B factor antagonist